MSSWSWLLKLSTSSFATSNSLLLMPFSSSYLSRFSSALEIFSSRIAIFFFSALMSSSRADGGGADGGEEEDEEEDEEDEDANTEDTEEEEDGEVEEEEGEDDFRSSFPRFEDDIVSFVFVNGKEGEGGMEEQEGRRGGRRAGESWKRRRRKGDGMFDWPFFSFAPQQLGIRSEFENAFCIVFGNAFCILVL